MKNSYAGALTLMFGALVLGGCASDKPVASVASSSQAVPMQSANASANARPAAATSTVQTAVVAPNAATNMVYFDYDSYTVKDQYAGVVRGNADYLANSNGAIELDGYADERGSREYNMALGQKRADAAKRALAVLGVKNDRIETISFGEDKPKGTGHNEAAWAENRRVDFVVKSGK